MDLTHPMAMEILIPIVVLNSGNKGVKMKAYFETTKEQFSIFKKEVYYWRDFFGLIDAEITVHHEDIDENASGCCDGDLNNRSFWITLNKHFEDNGDGNTLTDDEIRAIAEHEVIEVMLYPIRMMAVDRGEDWNKVDEAIHRIIRTLENVLIKKGE
jgi:hypothetical protein